MSCKRPGQPGGRTALTSSRTRADIDAVKAGLDAGEDEPAARRRAEPARGRARHHQRRASGPPRAPGRSPGSSASYFATLVRRRHALERALRRAEVVVPREISAKTAPRAVQRAEMWRQVLTAASTELAARASAAISLGDRARELLPDTGSRRDELAMRFDRAFALRARSGLPRPAHGLGRGDRADGAGPAARGRPGGDPRKREPGYRRRGDHRAGPAGGGRRSRGWPRRLAGSCRTPATQREALQETFEAARAAGQALLASRPARPETAADLSQAKIWLDELRNVAGRPDPRGGRARCRRVRRSGGRPPPVTWSDRIEALIPHLDGQQAAAMSSGTRTKPGLLRYHAAGGGR